MRTRRSRNQSSGKENKMTAAAAAHDAETDGKQVADARVTWNDLDRRVLTKDPIANDPREVDSLLDRNKEPDDIDWEEGSISILPPANNHAVDCTRTVTIEFSELPESAKRKPIHRATAEDKELAELVHKVQLLCLLARGRIIDSACDDPLIQASILSLLPAQLLKISEETKLRAHSLYPIVSWFHDSFHVRSIVSEKRSFRSALAFALETREGSPEEIAALSVALFRALKLTTRFVSILDVASIKPNVHRCDSSSLHANQVSKGIFSTSTLMVDRAKEASASTVKSLKCNDKENVCEMKSDGSCSRSKKTQSKGHPTASEIGHQIIDSLASEAENGMNEAYVIQKCQGFKRKGDLEFEMQLQMALSATSIPNHQSSMVSDTENSNSGSSNGNSPLKKMRRIASEESSSHGISTAVGSRKIGSPLYWAEVFCSGENLAGKWVHVDAVNAIIDGEQKVEDAAAACKTSLRYVVAFAGHGAKDVTRRYCMKWYKIASQRINSIWWDSVLAPLKVLESGATGGMVHMETPSVDGSNELENVKSSRVSNCLISDDLADHVNFHGKSGSTEMPEESRRFDVQSSGINSCATTRGSLEDMELETRALTEPLPTNQQAYKNHQLYAIERWLTRSQILHPKGPILGFCSGHPVYPRACVQTLKTKERWLRDGLQVKPDELPAKVLKQSGNVKRVQFSEDDAYGEADSEGIIELYGKWQLEPLQLPHAVDGVVPKNERGQVEVWSEKCLPPGTVHLRLPRVFNVAKRLEIDYAPAMVGFEFRNGRSVLVYDGIVVCSEFKDAILEAYAEEEERREAAENRRNEAQAISRWYQLLSSIITRQRLNNCYGSSSSTQISSNVQDTNNKSDGGQCNPPSLRCKKDVPDSKLSASSLAQTEDHEHLFLEEDQSFDVNSSTRTKRCHCGFSVQVEEL